MLSSLAPKSLPPRPQLQLVSPKLEKTTRPKPLELAQDSYLSSSKTERSDQENKSFSERVRSLDSISGPSVALTDQINPYQQNEPSLQDPTGDAHLIRILDKAPEEIVGGVWDYLVKGEKWHDHGGQATPLHHSGSHPKFSVDSVFADFQKIVADHPELEPHIGPEHQWSDEAKDYFGLGFFKRAIDAVKGKQDFPAPTVGDKLTILLGLGKTAQFAITGQEAALESKLMAYQDRSVSLADMMRESYVLHKGDLYGTFLCAENILAKDVNDPGRENQALQDKLEYIRDDEPQVGDNFGAWYHFFGTSLYGLVRSSVKAQGVALIEAAGSYFMEGPDPQETKINLYGAQLGGKLKKMVAER